MSYATLSYHWLDRAVQSVLQHRAELHLEPSCIFDRAGIEEDLVGFTEAEVEVVLVHQLAILLCSFRLHVGCGSRGEVKSGSKSSNGFDILDILEFALAR